MIVGSGDIAKVLNDREGAIFFASGVSDSSCTDDGQFYREICLLEQFMGDKRSLFYFSTFTKKDKPYFQHKQDMELLVKEWFNNYNIIRIGNIDWGTNPKTFLNAIKAKKAKGEPFEIFDEVKYMISKNELLLLTDNLPLTGKNEINVFGRMAFVKDLIK